MRLRVSERGSQWIFRDRVRQSVTKGLLGMQFLRRQEHLQRTRLADQTRQTLGAAPTGDQSERGPTMPEDGVRPGDATIARQRQVQSSAHAVTVYRGNGRSRETGHGIHQPLPHLRESKSFRSIKLGYFVQVSARGEEVGVAGQDESLRWVLCELLESGGESRHASSGEAVSAVGGDQTQDSSVTVGLKLAQVLLYLDR
jgi:hypothetical protein